MAAAVSGMGINKVDTIQDIFYLTTFENTNERGTTAMSMLSAPMRIRQTVNAVQCCFAPSYL